MEQEEYTREEINWSYIEFIDNQDVLDLIEKVVLPLLQLYPQFEFITTVCQLFLLYLILGLLSVLDLYIDLGFIVKNYHHIMAFTM